MLNLNVNIPAPGTDPAETLEALTALIGPLRAAYCLAEDALTFALEDPSAPQRVCEELNRLADWALEAMQQAPATVAAAK